MRHVGFGCAIILLLATVAPRDLARTSWERGGSVTNDSPAGYVGVMSRCGLAAFVGLAIGAWPRRAIVAATLFAAAPFLTGAYVAGNYWVNLALGVIGLEGRPDSSIRTSGYTILFPPLPPVFLLAAVVGLVCGVILAIRSRRYPARDRIGS